MSIWTCGLHAFYRKLAGDEKMSAKDKNLIAERMQKLADDWTEVRNDKFRNVKDAKWNNHETFDWLWEKYTHKPLNFSEFPPNFKDIRKFEAGLHYYNELVAKPQGLFASKFHLPRAAMQNIPELKRFESELINETSFFRDYTNETNRQVNDFLDHFKEFSLEEGSKITTISKLGSAGQKELARVQKEFDLLRQKWLTSTNKAEIAKLSRALRENRGRIRDFYNTGSGEAFKMVNNVLQGADIDTITRSDGTPISNTQKTKLNKMLDNYYLIRKAGVTGLVRGLQKVKGLAREKNLQWVDGTVDRINGLIKAIEFQHTIDENGTTINYKDMQSERDFLELGFKAEDRYSSNGKVKFSKHYMSQYTLGILKTVKKVEQAVDNNRFSLDKQIENEINSYESIVNVAKNRSPILNPVYDNDPYFFLKKYSSDVGIFNYQTHVKSTFKRAIDAVTNEHLNPAKEKGRTDLVEAAESMKKQLFDVYSEIQHMDPNADQNVSNWMRTLTSLTYFRLMGGNIRSAARNATQRLWEMVEFGVRAAAPFVGQAQQWYGRSGGAENNKIKLMNQLKRFGLQWFDGKSRSSNAFDIFKGKEVDFKVSDQSRGALEQSYMHDKTLYVDKNGELAIRGEATAGEHTARVAGSIAATGGKFHKIVEDWNRSKTFRVAFSLAHQNLESTSNTFKANEILKGSAADKIRSLKGENYQITYKDLQNKYGADTRKVMDNWIENQAGQMAYNSTLDVHFEYAKWNKAKAIKATKENTKAAGMAKMGLGQFAHYRFNMINLMHKWVKEAGLSLKAGDYRSEEVFRPIRYALVQGSLFAATLAFRTNFVKLAPDETRELGQKTYLWLTTDRNDPKQLERLDKETFGQGGFYFLGPNVNYIMSAYEFFTHATMGERKDERTQFAHIESLKKGVKKDENQELYEKLALINSQMARSVAYTKEIFKGGGGLKDVIALELGLFPSKEQKEWSKWLYGTKKKGRKKKLIKKTSSPYDRQAVLKALSGL